MPGKTENSGAKGAFAHVTDPTYPGALGHYVSLGDFYDRKGLRAFGDELVELNQRYRASYARAYQCLRAAKEVRQNGEEPFWTAGAAAKIKKRVQGILSREVKRKKGQRGRVARRFLGGLTCQGHICLYGTMEAQYKRIYELQDFSGLGGQMLAELLGGIQAAGYDVIAWLSPEDPTVLEHLSVPELSLAFVTTRGSHSLEKRPFRRIRLESMAEGELLKEGRTRLRFSNRMAAELQKDGIRELQQAKELHDALEAIYHPFVDFAGVNKLTRALAEEIGKLP